MNTIMYVYMGTYRYVICMPTPRHVFFPNEIVNASVKYLLSMTYTRPKNEIGIDINDLHAPKMIVDISKHIVL